MQFLEDEYYLGKCVKNLSPRWKKEFVEIFSLTSSIVLVVLTGPIGNGKTTFGSICQVRKLYELSCLKDHVGFYKLLPGTRFIFGIYNLTLNKADDTTELVRTYVDTSPYFNEICPRLKRPNDPIFFPSLNLEISTGSLSSHALGDSLLSFLLDEANFFKKTSSADNPAEITRAHQLFNEAFSRLVSRFMRRGRTPGLVIVISSKKFQTSFVDKMIKQIRMDPEMAKTAKVIEFPLWEAKDPADFSGETFSVLVGTEYWSSRVLELDEAVPRGAETVEVPIEYRPQFITDADLALRDIAGISTKGSSAFFPVKEKILQCIDDTRKHPFTMEEVSVPFLRTGEGAAVEDYMIDRMLVKIDRSQRMPLIRPGTKRNLHIDIAYKDECLGLAMAHPYQMLDGRLGVYVDLLLRVRPPIGGELDIGKTVKFINHLIAIGYRLDKVTFDQFQSRVPIQLLIQAGFKAEKLSLDLAHFIHLKTCFNEGRISIYPYKPLLEEFDHFMRSPDETSRPRHEVGYYDDIIDALASVVSLCLKIEKRTQKVERVVTSVPLTPVLSLGFANKSFTF